MPVTPVSTASASPCAPGRSSCPSCKSHLELEGEPSTIRQALQEVCKKCRMIRTCVRIALETLVRLTALRTMHRSATIRPMSRTVLIVDDHPSFRASARAMLEAEGFLVIGEAEDGAS